MSFASGMGPPARQWWDHPFASDGTTFWGPPFPVSLTLGLPSSLSTRALEAAWRSGRFECLKYERFSGCGLLVTCADGALVPIRTGWQESVSGPPTWPSRSARGLSPHLDHVRPGRGPVPRGAGREPLCRKGFIERVPHRNHYQLMAYGRATAVTITKLHARVVVPALSVHDADLGPPGATQRPIVAALAL